MGQDQDIKRYIYAVLRRWWVVGSLSIIIGVATYFVTPSTGPNWSAFSSLAFEDPNQQPSYALPFATGLAPANNNLGNQVQAIKSPQVLRKAAIRVLSVSGMAEVPPDSSALTSEIAALSKDVTVRQGRNSNVVGITAIAPTGELAAIRANAMAEAFVEFSADDQAASVSNRLASITRQIEGLQDARNEASSVDPQSIATLEDEVAIVGEDISLLLEELNAITQFGSVSVSSIAILSSMSDTLGTVVSDLNIVQANLLLLDDRQSTISGSGAAATVTSGLIASADLLERGAAQLDGIGSDSSANYLVTSAKLIGEIEASVLVISDSLGQAADNLSEIDESSLASQGLLGQAKTAAGEATSDIQSATNLVNDALSDPGPLVNVSRLRAARDSLGSMDNDVIRLISAMRFLSEGDGATAQTEERQQIINQFQAIQAEIDVVVVDIRAVRAEEDSSLNIGSLQTAEVQAQVARNEIDTAVVALQSVGQANAVVSISEIETKLRSMSNDVLGLPQSTADVISAGDNSEQLVLELLAEVTAIESSLDTSVTQIQARRAAESESDSFIPLFVAESRAGEGLAGLTAIKNDIEELADPSGSSISLTAIKDLGNDMIQVATELRLLDSEFGQSLARGTISDSQLTELSDRAGARSSALDLIIQSMPPLRNAITDVEVYGVIKNSEGRTLDAQRELALVVSELDLMTGDHSALIGAVSLIDVLARSQQVSETVNSANEDLDGLIATVVPGEPIPEAKLRTLGDRIVASGEIVLALSANMAAIRTPETDVEARARLIAVEEQLLASSVALASASDGIEQLTSRPSALVDRAIDGAVEEGRNAGETFNAAGQHLRLIREDMNAGIVIRPDKLEVLGEDFRILEQNILAVATSLQQAETNERLPSTQMKLATMRTSSENLGLLIGTAAGQFEILGQPSDAENTLYAQLLDSQRQLQLGRLIFDSPTVSVLQRAITASSTDSDETLTNAIVGLAAGFLLGLVLVVGLEYMDKRLRGQEDIKRQLGLAPLGVIPIAVGDWNPHPQITVDTPPSSFSESLRMVRSAVDIGDRSEKAQVLMVTSPREGDGKTTIALNLARSLAMENKKVLLVDGNLHTPEIGTAFQIKDGKGLSDALRTNSAPADYVVEAEGVHILPGGEPVDNPADVLATPSFRDFLESARNDYDVIVMDSPPAIGYADTVVLAKNADGVIFTYRARHTSTGDAEDANAVMQSVGVPTVGVVLNMADDRDSGVVYPKMRRTTPHPAPKAKWRLPFLNREPRNATNRESTSKSE